MNKWAAVVVVTLALAAIAWSSESKKQTKLPGRDDYVAVAPNDNPSGPGQVPDQMMRRGGGDKGGGKGKGAPAPQGWGWGGWAPPPPPPPQHGGWGWPQYG